MLSSVQIRNQLQRYLAGSISLDEFEDWLVGSSWNMHFGADPVAQALVSSIELRLAEYSSGHLSSEQMIEEFSSLLKGLVVLNVRLNAGPIVHRSGSSILIEKVEKVQLLAPPAEKQLLTVYA